LPKANFNKETKIFPSFDKLSIIELFLSPSSSFSSLATSPSKLGRRFISLKKASLSPVASS
jgi:hypothetical protein